MGIMLINASPVPRSRSGALLAAARQQLSALGHSPRQLCIADLPCASLLAQSAQEGAIRLATQALEQADALVIAAPVFKSAFSGLLKVFLDVLEPQALHGKKLLLLATGLASVQEQVLAKTIEPVLQSLGAEQILPGVFAPDHQVTLLPEGTSYVVHHSVQQRLEAALQGLVGSLSATPAWHLPRPSAGAFETALHGRALSAVSAYRV